MSVVAYSVTPLGDAALLVEFGLSIDEGTIDRVQQAVSRLQGFSGCRDIVPAYATIAIHFDEAMWDHERLSQAIDERLAPLRSEDFGSGVSQDPASAESSAGSRTLSLPVRYGGEDGPDIDALASSLGMSSAEVVERHSGAEYRVAFLGFTPGFPYLRGLDPALAVPRRSAPRPAVPAGSVGIGGEQTGVYPAVTPGGWHLIGRTGLRLFDPYRKDPCLLHAGDRVRFAPVATIRHEAAARVPPLPGRRAFSVEHGGMLSTLQDLGRAGHQHLGVSPGGALDRFAHSVANLLVGNHEQAPALEITLVGPRLIADCDMLVALCGARCDASIDGARWPLWQAVPVRRGARLSVGATTSGARACLAISGGFAAHLLLGGRGTALRDHFGGLEGRALAKGDVLKISDDPALRADHSGVSGESPRTGRMNRIPDRFVAARTGPVRVLRGPHWELLDDASKRSFTGSTFRVTPQADRMGLRLAGETLAFVRPVECVSAGVATGTIQLPPGGQPIVLLADRQTTGGYPRLGEIISADLDRLAQLRPGDEVSLTFCSMAEAREASRAAAATLQKVREWTR